MVALAMLAPSVVLRGANDDDSSLGTEREQEVATDAAEFWSFQPVVRPAIPTVSATSWLRNPIDSFILRRLEEVGLEPAPDASPRALLRRASYDLTGLPPQWSDVRWFQSAWASGHDDAQERLVERLLDSPRYGEKWGRHWLDLVRYAETNSYERDGAKQYVWRYRDYVIRAFNSDKPYNRFVAEQLAGDELADRSADSVIATGYYRLGLWDDEPGDALQQRHDELDDIVTTTSNVFMGLTINCARCHDHKIDPIAQQEYYEFLDFFGGIKPFYDFEAGRGFSDKNLYTDLPNAESPSYSDPQWNQITGQQEIGDVAKEIAHIEEHLLGRLTGADRDDFQHDEYRVEVVRRNVPQRIRADELTAYVTVRKRRVELQQALAVAGQRMRVLCAKGTREPPSTHVLARGNPNAPLAAVTPGFPRVLARQQPRINAPPANAESSLRRLVLVEWLTRRDHPLLARVIVNRIWQHHFGRGLVRTPNDFGYGGFRPTHPRLLDWLADELIRSDWSMKRIHRLIMTSRTYRMSSVGHARGLAVDPANDTFWRFNMRRLTAEELRDSLIAVSDSLNHVMYGPWYFPRVGDEVFESQSIPGNGWGESTEAERARRSVYRHVKRTLIPPLMATHDVADTDASCPVRFASTQPTQALTMINGDFVRGRATAMAVRARHVAGSRTEDQVRYVLASVLVRRPSEQEVARGAEFMRELTDLDGIADEQALEQLCVLALNLNEFVYLD